MAGNAEFDDAWMTRFREIIEIKNEAALAALHAELIEIGQRYRRIIQNIPCDLKGAPFNKSLTQRIDWLQVNAVRPAERLLAALADDQRAWYATWPYEHEFDEFPDRESLRAELQKVHAFSSRLMAVLQGEQDVDAGTNQELRFYIFNDIVAAVRKHLPAFHPSQGVYHRDVQDEGDGFQGRFPKAIRHIYQEITGLDEQLVRLIRMVVKDPDWQL